MKKYTFTLFLLISCVVFSQTQTPSTNNALWEFELRAGLSLGGASPIPLPVQIRKIENYNPKFNGFLEGSALYWVNNQWGVSTGLRLEEKGMRTRAKVKNYYTALIRETNTVKGYYTGQVQTHYSSTFLTLPILVHYKFAQQWRLRTGIHTSVFLGGIFEGEVSNGHLREGTPIGEKAMFENDKKGLYDFSSSLRSVQFAAQGGVQCFPYERFSVSTDLIWGFSNIFKANFNTISFKMSPIYLAIGFGYKF